MQATKRLRSEIAAEGAPSRMKQARKDAGVKAKDLAQLAGIDPPQLSHFESGRKGLDTPLLLALLAAANSLGIDVVYVISGERSTVGPGIRELVMNAVRTLRGEQIPASNRPPSVAPGKPPLPTLGGKQEQVEERLDGGRKGHARK